MISLNDNELQTVKMPFLALDKMLQDVPENKQIRDMVNECLTILSRVSNTSNPIGGSSSRVGNVTKSLFEMFHIGN